MRYNEGFNPLLYSTGIQVREERMVKKGSGLFVKENNTLLVENIYPFMFLGCGKLYTLEQCLDWAFQCATDKINSQINKY